MCALLRYAAAALRLVVVVVRIPAGDGRPRGRTLASRRLILTLSHCRPLGSLPLPCLRRVISPYLTVTETEESSQNISINSIQLNIGL